jgi:hypothetical protein
MAPNREVFSARYRSEPDEALIALLEGLEDLVPEAQSALLSEIARRDLNVDVLKARYVKIDHSEKIQRAHSRQRAFYFVIGVALAIFLLGFARGSTGIELNLFLYIFLVTSSGFVTQWIMTNLFRRRLG